ncbi:hypothetical protein AN641_08900 [Candidatus Epulonipiscioides gigas]|nr:hypothetical protein AN641_08900 [Epulopiscium sp. SCG-C07WGA-EpuloA2]
MNKKILQIVVPITMLGIVGGIWFSQKQADEILLEQQIVYETEDFNLHATNIDLEQLKAHKLPMIIDFGADECIPCKQMAPVLEKVNADMHEKAIVKFVDVWKHPSAAKDYPVQVIPTQVIFNSDGTPYVPSEEVAQIIHFDNYANRETKEHMYTVHVGGLTEEQMLIILSDMGV